MQNIEPSPESVLLSEAQIQNRIIELGAQISSDYDNRDLVLLCILRGGVLFFADLARAISVPLRFEFVQIMSYYDNIRPSQIQFIRGSGDYLQDRHILIVDDIADTGHTLQFLIKHLQTLSPATIKACTLLDKTSQRQVPVTVDYVGFEIPNVFAFGYGLDYKQLYRNLPYVAVLEPPSENAAPESGGD